MNPNRNIKLKTFVDMVLTRVAAYAKSHIDGITVEYNRHTDVYWFILSVHAAFMENQKGTSLDELETVPRMVQLGAIPNGGDLEFLVVFMNERGVYTNAIPHTLPAARCSNAQSKDVSVVIFNYLTRGIFTAGLDYRMVHPLGVPENKPKAQPVSDEEARTNRQRYLAKRNERKLEAPPLELSRMQVHTRLKNILIKKYNITTVIELTKRTAPGLMALEGIGRTSVYQLQRELERYGLSLASDPWTAINDAK